jgi:hypothetical protein
MQVAAMPAPSPRKSATIKNVLFMVVGSHEFEFASCSYIARVGSERPSLLCCRQCIHWFRERTPDAQTATSAMEQTIIRILRYVIPKRLAVDSR